MRPLVSTMMAGHPETNAAVFPTASRPPPTEYRDLAAKANSTNESSSGMRRVLPLNNVAPTPWMIYHWRLPWANELRALIPYMQRSHLDYCWTQACNIHAAWCVYKQPWSHATFFFFDRTKLNQDTSFQKCFHHDCYLYPVRLNRGKKNYK